MCIHILSLYIYIYVYVHTYTHNVIISIMLIIIIIIIIIIISIVVILVVVFSLSLLFLKHQGRWRTAGEFLNVLLQRRGQLADAARGCQRKPMPPGAAQSIVSIAWSLSASVAVPCPYPCHTHC